MVCLIIRLCVSVVLRVRTPVFAALVAVINTKLPQVGELVVTRLVSQFRRSFKRNDKVRSDIVG